MDKKTDSYIIFFVNKNGLKDFVIIDAIDFKDAIIVSKSFSKATKCEILGVCRNCFKTFKLNNHE
jgi:hypothetical protein